MIEKKPASQNSIYGLIVAVVLIPIADTVIERMTNTHMDAPALLSRMEEQIIGIREDVKELKADLSDVATLKDLENLDDRMKFENARRLHVEEQLRLSDSRMMDAVRDNQKILQRLLVERPE